MQEHACRSTGFGRRHGPVGLDWERTHSACECTINRNFILIVLPRLGLELAEPWQRTCIRAGPHYGPGAHRVTTGWVNGRPRAGIMAGADAISGNFRAFHSACLETARKRTGWKPAVRRRSTAWWRRCNHRLSRTLA